MDKSDSKRQRALLFALSGAMALGTGASAQTQAEPGGPELDPGGPGGGQPEIVTKPNITRDGGSLYADTWGGEVIVEPGQRLYADTWDPTDGEAPPSPFSEGFKTLGKPKG